ncbi:MAG: hypothetical protein H7255_14195 [Ramlibacter sp.]|nr:hypothetical protein [Ramlibacter sp.]
MNSRYGLQIPTPDGSGQAVHPDVLHVPDGFLGYAYWMGCTPYPFAADRLENPIVRVSHDGVRWTAFPGAPDPLVEAPANGSWHHADTDIVLHRGTLYVFYISTNREAAETVFSFVCSTDGVRWSAPLEIYSDTWGVSPAVLVGNESDWSMWYVFRDALADSQVSTVYRSRGASLATFGPPERCDLQVPGHVVWHLDVIRSGHRVEALVTAFPKGTDPSRSRLFHAESDDGRVFRLASTSPLIRPTLVGWDNRMIYRSSFVKRRDNSYRVWYSAASWGMRCGIGLVEGPIDRLAPVTHEPRSSGPSVLRRFSEDAIGLAKYLALRMLSASAHAWLLSTRARLRATVRAARPSTRR